MLKFLTIFIIVCYVVYKVGGYLMRSLFISTSQQNQAPPHSQKKSRKVPDSDLNIDYVPHSEKKNRKKDFDGGEYVDYEDVK